MMKLSRLAGIAAAGLILALAGCVLDGNSRKAGIRYDHPVVGARETYVRYSYGSLFDFDSVKTYTQDSLILEVLSVAGNSVRLAERTCWTSDSACTVQEIVMDRATGRIETSSEVWSELRTLNLFPSGLFTKDSLRQITFNGYRPVVEKPAVGFAPEVRLGRKTYRNVTVFADPTYIPVDGGGHCLILSEDMRLVEMYHYDVFGVDGGWEARD